MDIDRLDHFQLQSSGVDFLHQRLDLLFRPVDTGGLIQQTHQAGHAGNLLHILQRNRVGLAAIPAECHFHGDVSSFCFAKPPVFAAVYTGPGLKVTSPALNVSVPISDAASIFT